MSTTDCSPTEYERDRDDDRVRSVSVSLLNDRDLDGLAVVYAAIGSCFGIVGEMAHSLLSWPFLGLLLLRASEFSRVVVLGV
jgi:hypothetical protein